MTAYRGQNIKTLKVWYTGFVPTGTLANRSATVGTAAGNTIALTAGSNGVLATGQLPIGAVLCRDPFAWDNGGSKIGSNADANPAAVRTGSYEGLDYTQPTTGILNQHKVVVVEPGIAPAGNPNGGRWVTVVEVGDSVGVILSGNATTGDNIGVSNGTFAVASLPITSVAEIATILSNGIGQILETEAGGAGFRLRAAKLNGATNPAVC